MSENNYIGNAYYTDSNGNVYDEKGACLFNICPLDSGGCTVNACFNNTQSECHMHACFSKK